MPLATDKIKHLVVLMMENRSFDHMFGFMQGPGYAIDGLTGNEAVPDSQGQSVTVSRDADISGDLSPDPGHHFPDVNFQIFSDFMGPKPGVPLMQGFVKAYEQHTHDRNKSHRIMKCFDHSRIPFLTTLAKEYAVCDRWFSSVPGPTLPNRSFAHAATSIGRVDMNPIWRDEGRTIYELLDKFGVDSKIFYQDWSIALTFKNFANSQGKWFGIYDDFERACNTGQLPAYSFVEPRYNDSDQGQDGVFEASDQHPDHNITEGDRLIGDVYKAIRSNQALWESTMLVITYDEHGGTYDHVIPPATVNPDGKNADKPGENIAPGIPPFDFKRLGVRVPAVIVSPYIPAGTIDSTVYDHTSFLAMARKLFLGNDAATNFLTERDRQANTFEHLLTLSIPRIDQVNFKTPAVSFSLNPFAGAPANNLDKTLSVHQRDLVEQAFEAEKTLPPDRQSGLATANQILTERQASVYLKSVADALRGIRPAAATGAPQ